MISPTSLGAFAPSITGTGTATATQVAAAPASQLRTPKPLQLTPPSAPPPRTTPRGSYLDLSV